MMIQAANKIRLWRSNPVQFVRDNFQVEPDKWQESVLSNFANPDTKRIAMMACAGPGKSAVLAWCGWNFLSCYGAIGQHPKGAAVSITNDNLSDNLWAELAKWRNRSQYLMTAFEWTKTRVFAKDHPETWFLSARSWAKTANAEEQGRVLSGLHSEYVIYLIDESGDQPPSILRAAEQGLSNCKIGKILQAGNPTSQEGMLYHSVISQRANWQVTNITADPDDPNRSNRIDKAWAQSQIDMYGRDNPWVQAYILSQFPSSSLNTLLSVEEVEASIKRFVGKQDYDFSQKRIGVDVARFGDDKTVLFPRQGLIAFKPTELRGARTNDIAALLLKMKIGFDSEMELIDDTGGYGSGVIDSYLQAGQSAIPVNFSSSASDVRYFNRRSEMWFEMADWIKRGGGLPDVPELRRELTTPTYTFQKGKFRLEEKDQIKKRLGYSPDYADALAITFALPEMPARMTIDGMIIKSKPDYSAEYNPFEEARL